MTITPEEVKRIAVLARLGLSNAEVEQATHNLSGVLDHFSAIQDIDTDSVPEADAVSGLSNVTREDVAAPGSLCTAAELLDNAPDVQNGSVKVKAVF